MWSYAFHLRLSKTINLKPNALFTLLASHEHFSFLALCAWTEEFVWINFLRSWVVLLAKKICMQSAQFKCAIKWINLSHHSAFFAYFQSIFHIKKKYVQPKKNKRKKYFNETRPEFISRYRYWNSLLFLQIIFLFYHRNVHERRLLKLLRHNCAA